MPADPRYVKAAKRPDAKVLIVEMVVPPPSVMHRGKVLDMTMLTIAGGQERTEEEYGALLATAGLRLTRVIPTMSPASIVEAEQARRRANDARSCVESRRSDHKPPRGS
jgi:hypothetical protein